MNCVCWNVRGTKGGGKDEALKQLVGKTNLFFLCLVETKHSQVQDSKIKKWWGVMDYK